MTPSMISRLSRGALKSIGGAFFDISARRAAIFFAFSRSTVLRFLEPVLRPPRGMTGKSNIPEG